MTPEAMRDQQRAVALLREGNAAGASELLEAVIARGEAEASSWLSLAFARARLGRPEATLEAIDRALELEPRNLRALLFKGDHLDHIGQPRLALSFYEGALRVAAQEQNLPQDVLTGLNRARAFSDRQAADYQAYLHDALAADGFRADGDSRFHEALDIAFGRSPVQLQQPTRFYFPGLPQRAFYEREEFAWIEAMESQTDVIRDELRELMEDEGCFDPYLEKDPHAPELNDRGNVDNLDWSAFFLWKDGEVVADNAGRCPRTMDALAQVPQPHVPGQTPSALFSRLAPGAAIPPHHGVLNTRLICHLPLVVPENCGSLRVGNHRRPWKEGEILVFNDSMEHEANNASAKDRVVLLFDIWRPELTEEERHWVTRMLQAVRDYETPM